MTSPVLNHTQTFKDHLRGNLKNGITCSGELGQYVPYSFLRRYWTPQVILSLLQEARIPGTKPRFIINHYLRVFSILVYTSNLHLLQSFISARKNDSSLPWPQTLDFLDKTDTEYHMLFSTQWKFCPVLLDPDTELCDTQLHKWSILPFEEKESAQEPRPNEREATTKIMVVHKDAHAHLPKSRQVPQLVFLKTYEEAFHDVYHLERTSNSVFASNEIAPCKGSFHWFDETNGRTSTLIFQYTEHGTLLDLFREGLQPYLPEDIKAFWKGIVGIAKGLETIHHQVGYEKGLHHDVKPSNILVFSKGVKDGKLVYEFKIGDFGASYLVPTNVHFETFNRGTTRTYAPPEIYLGDSVKYIVGPTLDMWSIGCIIIEAAVWLVLGERGRQDFRRKRMEEISKLPNLQNLGYGDCFHNGTAALPCIAEYVELMKTCGRQSDEITRQIVKLATKNLLVVRDSRINSLNLYTRLCEILDDERLLEVSSPAYSTDVNLTRSLSTVRSGMPSRNLTGQPLQGEPGKIPPREMSEDEDSSKTSAPGSGPTQPNGSTQPAKPGKPTNSNASRETEAELYIDQLSSWIKENKKKTQWHNNELPGWKLVQGQLKGRVFIFLVDNSKSMQEYEEEVLQWISKLSYLVKELDPDRGEIRCTSDHNETVKFKTSTDAKNIVLERFADGKGGPCDMEDALFGVVDSIRGAAPTISSRLSFKKRSGSVPKKTSVIVFTDGVWDSSIEDGLLGADEPIESLIKHMKKKDIGRPNISIQFLRFGSNPVGIRRLKYLDDDLGKKHKFDIVDHKPVEACIWKILKGAVSKSTD